MTSGSRDLYKYHLFEKLVRAENRVELHQCPFGDIFSLWNNSLHAEFSPYEYLLGHHFAAISLHGAKYLLSALTQKHRRPTQLNRLSFHPVLSHQFSYLTPLWL
jgi:hypothetical protein